MKTNIQGGPKVGIQYIINVIRYTSAQSFLFLSTINKATCFDQKLVIFRPVQKILYRPEDD